MSTHQKAFLGDGTTATFSIQPALRVASVSVNGVGATYTVAYNQLVTITPTPDAGDVVLVVYVPLAPAALYEAHEVISGAVSYPTRAGIVTALPETLLRFDGASGGSPLTDSGTVAKTWSNVNAAVLSDAQAKFGTASGLFDGVNQILTCDYSGQSDLFTTSGCLRLDAANWTLEGWYYPTTNDAAARRIICWGGGIGVSWPPLQVYLKDGRIIWNGCSTNGGIDIGTTAPQYDTGADGGTFTVNAWNHFALVREGGASYKFYNNGILTHQHTTALAPFAMNQWGVALGTMCTGAYKTPITNQTFKGYLDEIALWANQARYTREFVPRRYALTTS